MEIIVITNGTILPDAHLIKALQHPKVTVQLSDYGKLSRKKELLSIFCSNHIKHWLFMQKWYELTAFHRKKLTEPKLRHVTTGCCKLGGNGDPYLMDGKLYRCPIQGNLHRLGIFESDDSDYVNLRQSDKDKMQREIEEFINVKKTVHITKLCHHCNGRGYTGVEVPPAQQLAPGERIQVRFE